MCWVLALFRAKGIFLGEGWGLLDSRVSFVFVVEESDTFLSLPLS